MTQYYEEIIKRFETAGNPMDDAQVTSCMPKHADDDSSPQVLYVTLGMKDGFRIVSAI